MAQKSINPRPRSPSEARQTTERKNKVTAERLARAENVIKKMTADYLEWVQNDLGKMEGAIARIVPGQEQAISFVEEIYRLAHDVKGQGGSFNYHLMTDIGGIVCRYIENIEDINAEDVDALGECVRAMRKIIDGRLSGDGGKKGAQILLELAPIAEKAIPLGA